MSSNMLRLESRKSTNYDTHLSEILGQWIALTIQKNRHKNN